MRFLSPTTSLIPESATPTIAADGIFILDDTRRIRFGDERGKRFEAFFGGGVGNFEKKNRMYFFDKIDEIRLFIGRREKK